MLAPLQLQHIERPGYTISLFVPDAQEVQNNYLRQKQEQADVPFSHTGQNYGPQHWLWLIIFISIPNWFKIKRY